MRSLLFDKSGLFSGLIYWAGIGLIAGLLARPAGIYVKLTAILFSIGIVTIFANSVIDAVQHKDGMFVGFIEGLLHIFEITMGYLANTVSFIRISAFALNHFGFFMTIFAISDMLKNADMSVLSLPFVILGNIFVLFLEGLVVMIQCLRLNYYEFFSRFFVSGKRLYNPLTLKTSSKNIKQYLS
jgi:V/A-type H+-transporting ATPase subunit I